MDHEDTELDRMQNAYKSSIDVGVAAVRAEEQLARSLTGWHRSTHGRTPTSWPKSSVAKRRPRRPVTRTRCGSGSSHLTHRLMRRWLSQINLDVPRIS